jgi:hypothetical protein
MTEQPNINDDDITTSGPDDQPTERDDNLDAGGEGPRDTGDEPTEDVDDRDTGGEGSQDTGDV